VADKREAGFPRNDNASEAFARASRPNKTIERDEDLKKTQPALVPPSQSFRATRLVGRNFGSKAAVL